MKIINKFKLLLHRLLEMLNPGYLPPADGTYIVKTENEKMLNVEQICAYMRDQGGFSGDYKVLNENVRQFLDEAAYLLCDGYAVNMGYFSVHPNVSGFFNSIDEIRNFNKQPASFSFRVRSKLLKLARQISLDIAGLAETNAFIDSFIDYEENMINSQYVPGNIFGIFGNKIKVAGDHPSCGVYFVPVENPRAAVKVADIAENTHSRITGIVPRTGYLHHKIEIRTQYTGSPSRFLEAPRTITSRFTVEAA